MPKTIFLPTANTGTDGANILIADDVDIGDVVDLPQDGVSYDAFQRVATGVVASAWSPVSLGAKLTAWWDFSDPAVLFEDAARTNPVEDGDGVDGVLDKSANGYHVSADNRSCTWDATHQQVILSGDENTDLLTDLTLADITRTATMEMYFAIKTADTSFMLASASGLNQFMMLVQDGSGAAAHLGTSIDSYQTGDTAVTTEEPSSDPRAQNVAPKSLKNLMVSCLIDSPDRSLSAVRGQ